MEQDSLPQDHLPTEDEFFCDGIAVVHPAAIPEEQIDKCCVCLTTFGEPTGDGDLERLVRVHKCGHIIGRDCLVQWLASSRETKVCPVCRTRLYRDPLEQVNPHGNAINRRLEEVFRVLDQIFRHLASRLGEDPLDYRVLNEEDSAALRQSTNITFDDSVIFLLNFHQRRFFVYFRGRWPDELGVGEGDTLGLSDALTAIRIWIITNYSTAHHFNEAEQGMMLEAAGGVHPPALDELGTVDEVWGRIPNERVGRLTQRLTLIFVHTYLAFSLGRQESLVELISIL